MLKFPKKTKFKSPHLHRSEKGLKGSKKTAQALQIKTRENHLMTPQQRGFADVSCKIRKRAYGSLNIRFSHIYHFLKNFTNTYG